MRAVQRLHVYLLKGSLRNRFTSTALLLPLYYYRFTSTTTLRVLGGAEVADMPAERQPHHTLTYADVC
jgi:hypothetical protein